MINTRRFRPLALVLVTAIVVPAMPSPARADERTIRCESVRGRYRFCPADTDNRVELRRQLSGTPCHLWRNWGYDRRGVWVDDGCRAEFRVGKGLSGGETAAIVGGIAAAAIIAGIIASKSGDKSGHDRNVPEWAVGSFRGWDDVEGVALQLNIAPSGGVQGWANHEEFTGRLESDRLYTGGRTFRVSRRGDGILLDEVGGRRQRMELWRTW